MKNISVPRKRRNLTAEALDRQLKINDGLNKDLRYEKRTRIAMQILICVLWAIHLTVITIDK